VDSRDSQYSAASASWVVMTILIRDEDGTVRELEFVSGG
jgi:hypothetical protein